MDQEIMVALLTVTGLPVTHKTDPDTGFAQFTVTGKRNFVRMTKEMMATMHREGIGGKSFWWLVDNLRTLRP